VRSKKGLIVVPLLLLLLPLAVAFYLAAQTDRSILNESRPRQMFGTFQNFCTGIFLLASVQCSRLP
jgi:hypothetical protein